MELWMIRPVIEGLVGVSFRRDGHDGREVFLDNVEAAELTVLAVWAKEHRRLSGYRPTWGGSSPWAASYGSAGS
jgi:hypothetical protein